MLYRFKVSLFHDKKIYREIELNGADTLETLHEAIFQAYDRGDKHMYSFYLSRVQLESLDKVTQYAEYTLTAVMDGFADFDRGDKAHITGDVAETTVAELGLEVNDMLYYLFDFGDEWWHELTLLSISEKTEPGDYPRIVNRVGESPSQYPLEDGD